MVIEGTDATSHPDNGGRHDDSGSSKEEDLEKEMDFDDSANSLWSLYGEEAKGPFGWNKLDYNPVFFLSLSAT